jgi:endogenous inhibitor of DNA gyrase (YacG/DUF329 family)
MRRLTSAELLNIWEDGSHFTLTGRSLYLLQVACSGEDLNSMADLSIGERDARLLQLREWMFGSRLVNKMNCPRCGELVEWVTEIADIRLQAPRLANSTRIVDLQVEDVSIRFRLPNSHDLTRAISNPDYGADPRNILSACILTVHDGKQDLLPQDLPEKVWDAMEEEIEKEDPQADIRMQVECPVCSYQWDAHFDIASYLWTEIDNWARHITYEVYLLARTFGWAEKDILNMSPRRRQLYIDMLS